VRKPAQSGSTGLTIRTPKLRVAKGRDWARRLGPALALACLATGYSATTALADSMTLTLNPIHGQAGAGLTASAAYFNSPTHGCLVGMAIAFTWGPNNIALGSVPLDAACAATLKFTPPDKTPGVYTTTATATQTQIAAQARYTIDQPTPPPSPTPTPPPTTPPPTTPPPTTPPPTTPPPTTPPPTTPPPTTPPPTTPPPTTPPPTTPPPTTPPPTHRSSPIPTPVQHVAPSPTAATGCVAGTVSAACPPPSPTPCKQTAAVAPPPGPGGTGGGLMLALALFGSLPITAVFLNSRYLIRRRELARLACLLGAAALLVAGTSCARPIAGIHTLATPTPTASGPIVPTPTC
jgi:hypothetical protein